LRNKLIAINTFLLQAKSVEPQIIFSKRRTVGLQISPKGLFVRVPLRTPMKYINNLLESKKEWIKSKLRLLEKKRQGENKNKDFLNTEKEIWLFGERLEICQIVNQSLQPNLNCRHPQLDWGSKNNDINLFYKKELERYIAQKLSHFTNLIGVDYSDMKVKQLKSKWGSCSSKGVLVFNSSLAKCPDWIIDYVIIHELCHRKQMNHSKKFWDLVTQFCPNWRGVKKWFRVYGENVLN
jgi:predicted metal-dependent hydrolase